MYICSMLQQPVFCIPYYFQHIFKCPHDIISYIHRPKVTVKEFTQLSAQNAAICSNRAISALGSHLGWVCLVKIPLNPNCHALFTKHPIIGVTYHTTRCSHCSNQVCHALLLCQNIYKFVLKINVDIFHCDGFFVSPSDILQDFLIVVGQELIHLGCALKRCVPDVLYQFIYL